MYFVTFTSGTLLLEHQLSVSLSVTQSNYPQLIIKTITTHLNHGKYFYWAKKKAEKKELAENGKEMSLPEKGKSVGSRVLLYNDVVM